MDATAISKILDAFHLSIVLTPGTLGVVGLGLVFRKLLAARVDLGRHEPVWVLLATGVLMAVVLWLSGEGFVLRNYVAAVVLFFLAVVGLDGTIGKVLGNGGSPQPGTLDLSGSGSGRESTPRK